MILSFKRNGMTLCLCLSLAVIYGCGQSAPPAAPPGTAGGEHGHGDHGHDHGHDEEHAHSHDSLAGAVAELSKLRDTIKDGFAKNDIDAAHGPLHDVGHILELIPELAEKEKLPAESVTAIKAAVETLFTAFGDVDKGMHGQEGVKYSDVSAKVDEAVEVLKKAAAGQTAPPAESQAPAADAAPAADGNATSAEPAASSPPVEPAAEPAAPEPAK
ncbi:MAG: hypothetical protein ACK526_17595 [Planctomyces sp.]|jgi:hypothetical protein